MKSRVAEAMYTVWSNRCREICRNVEFGGALGIIQADSIRFARVRDEPRKAVGVFHMRRHSAHEFEVAFEVHYHPPRDGSLVPSGYRHLFFGPENSFLLMPKGLFATV